MNYGQEERGFTGLVCRRSSIRKMTENQLATLVVTAAVVSAETIATTAAEKNQNHKYPRTVIIHECTPPFVYTLSYGILKKMFLFFIAEPDGRIPVLRLPYL